MSATNRGKKRNEQDFYSTPTSAIESILNEFSLGDGIDVLEPGAGNGNIIQCLQKKYNNLAIDAIEIRQDEYNALKQLGVNVVIDDFLNMQISKKYDLIIGNPPFSLAIKFINKCLNLLKPGGTLIFLLRTAFMESDRRFDFWQKEKNQLTGLYTLHKRPSFTGKGTDATSYSWFVWQPGNKMQTIKII